jgi:hypothetical protein
LGKPTSNWPDMVAGWVPDSIKLSSEGS